MHTDFLRECEAEIAALKERIALLEERLAAFAAQPAPQAEEEVDFTGIEIGAADLEPADIAATAGVESSTGAVDREGSQSDVVVEASSGAVSSAGTFARTGSRSDVEVEDSAPEEAKKPSPEAPRETYPWQLAAPGATVKNIRSGISLLDRALFIGTLFKEDYALYDATIAALNGMGSLQEAEDYILAHFPEWNLKSDAVFNFMMAVRKKLG